MKPKFTATSFDSDWPQNHESSISVPDLYAILNLDRNADSEAIRSSYKTLCMAFHPDRHSHSAASLITFGDTSNGNSVNSAATKRFHEISYAFEVLNDPNQRQIYDLYGYEGLENIDNDSKMEVGFRLRSKEELRYEYESRARLAEDLKNSQSVQSMGAIKIVIDASPLCSPQPTNIRRFRKNNSFQTSLPKLGQVSVYHSWQVIPFNLI